MEFVDIAGLVKGAAQGEGLGNQFLSHIRETDAIAHVVRCFDDTDVIHVSGQIAPLQDIETIHTELLLADLETLERARQKISKNAKSGNKALLIEKEILDALFEHMNHGDPVRTFRSAHPETPELLKRFQFITLKPLMYIANVDEHGFQNNPYLDQVQHLATQEGAQWVSICAALESEIAELEPSEQQAFLETMGQSEPGLHRVMQAGYRLLGLQTYFTAGPKEVHAWTIPIGATAPQAASVIHSDFEKGFIRAEVIGYADFIQYKGEAGAKEAGRWRLEGSSYIVQDGDLMHFRFNV
jgi:hypothetical protein